MSQQQQQQQQQQQEPQPQAAHAPPGPRTFQLVVAMTSLCWAGCDHPQGREACCLSPAEPRWVLSAPLVGKGQPLSGHWFYEDKTLANCPLAAQPCLSGPSGGGSWRKGPSPVMRCSIFSHSSLLMPAPHLLLSLSLCKDETMLPLLGLKLFPQ